MEKVEPNTIYTIIDTVDGPEQVSTNLDDMSLEEVKELAEQIPGIYRYLLARIAEEQAAEDKSAQ